MSIQDDPAALPPSQPGLFAPKLVSVWQAGYRLADLRRDALAGLTVAIVALPLSMAIAIASGASPAAGLNTAIVGGFLVSALGGSRYQIGGPAGAFIVLVAAVIAKHGFEGLVIATMMAGVLLAIAGAARLGGYIRYIPHPVLVGFTTGIAVIIFASQLHDLLGLTLPGKEPGALWPKLVALAGALPTSQPAALATAAFTIATILLIRRWRPQWPGLLFAVVGATLLATLLHLDIETIGTRFGGIPQAPPLPHWPAITLERLVTLAPDALSIAVLAGIESLLSAVVADGMSARRHRPDMELFAQGVANIGSALFGGICVTGTIARTATNIRSGAVSPVSGLLHALFILLFILVAAPLGSYIPLSALAGVLVVVAWNMAERHEFAAILRARGPEMLVLLVTFGLTIFVDLMIAIAAGIIMGSLIFMHRMAGMVDVAPASAGTSAMPPPPEGEPMVYVLRGPLFFGATGALASMLDAIDQPPRSLTLDFSAVPLADSTAAHMLKRFVERLRAKGTAVTFRHVSPPVRATLDREGLGAYLMP